MARHQLEGLGFTRSAIAHRIEQGRLRPLSKAVYAVSQLELTREGRWMAAILACGDGACLSHRSAGALFGICEERKGVIEISVRRSGRRTRPGIKVHRRPSLPSQDVGTLNGIPVTSPVRTMIDLATEQGPRTLLRTINEADNRDVICAEDLREELDAYAGQPGVRPLRTLLDRDTFVLSDEELERLFLPLAREVGLPLPMTKEMVNGYEVDFFWPALKLVVETDGLRYHRTPSAQAKDARRDQAHTAAGYARLRFTHWQVKYERDYVLRILSETTARLNRRG
ncbi:MAG TPA: DUF559 domain-containing protein [Solirubrobacterales bacterium]|nr:DUF559 domain-containing protein [Solirubrobacterales bacterium]